MLVGGATAVALATRPWRALGGSGPPWPWLAMAALLPLLWGLDRYAAVPLLPALSGAPLLVLMAGWPLAILAMLPAAVITAFAGSLEPLEVLHRLAWLGVVPATLLLGLGAALRRWLPRHLFVYILGRGFLGTGVAVMLAAAASWWLHPATVGTAPADALVGRLLSAFGEAFLTGMVTAILVAFRPEWLATYADRLYLPAAPPPR